MEAYPNLCGRTARSVELDQRFWLNQIFSKRRRREEGGGRREEGGGRREEGGGRREEGGGRREEGGGRREEGGGRREEGRRGGGEERKRKERLSTSGSCGSSEAGATAV